MNKYPDKFEAVECANWVYRVTDHNYGGMPTAHIAKSIDLVHINSVPHVRIEPWYITTTNWFNNKYIFIPCSVLTAWSPAKCSA